MASRYSTPKNFDNYVTPIDTELVNFVLQSKQQKFDYNMAKVEQTLSQFGNLGLVRNEDKQYLSDKINSQIESLGNIEELDWSDPNVGRQIDMGLKGSIDGKVLNDIKLSRGYTSFQQQLQQVMEDNPDEYSEANAAYAVHQSGLGSWLNGETDSYKINELKYNPFVDVSAKYRDVLDESIAMTKGITRQVVDPTDESRYITSTHYGLTEQDVKDKVLQNLTPQEQKQLEINAWSQFGDNAPQAYDAYTRQEVESLTKSRKNYEINMEGKTPAQKAIARAEIQKIDRDLSQIKAVKKSPQALYGYLGQEALVKGLSATYAPIETSRKYSDNTGYLKQLEMQSKNLGTFGTGASDIDANRTGIPDVTTKTRGGEEFPDYEFAKEAEKGLKKRKETLNRNVNGLLGRLSQEDRDDLELAYNQYIEDNGLIDSVENKTAFILDKSNSGRGNLFKPSEVYPIKNELRRYNREREIQVSNSEEALEEIQEKNLQNMFSGIKEGSSDIQMLDENGKIVPMKTYLRGVDNIDELSLIQKKTLLKSVYADLALSQTKDFARGEAGDNTSKNKFNITNLAKVNGELKEDLPMMVHPLDISIVAFSEDKLNTDFEGLKKDMNLPSDLTLNQFEEHIRPVLESSIFTRDKEGFDFADVWYADENIPFIGGVMRGTREALAKTYSGITRGLRDIENNIIIGGEGTQTRKDLETALEKGLYDTSFGTDSVEDEGKILNALGNNKQEYDSLYNAKMKEDAPNFARNNIILIEPSGTRKGEEVPAFNEIVAQAGLDPKAGVVQVVEDETGDYYIATQQEAYRNEEGEIKSKTREGFILKEDIKNGAFMQWISTRDNEDRITSDNTSELPSDSIGFADAKSQREYLSGVSRMFGINSQQGLENFTSQGAKKNLFQAHPEIFDNPQHGAYFKDLAKKMIDNSHLFRINMIPDSIGTFEMAIQYQEKEDGKVKWKNLNVLPTNKRDITQSTALIDVAPQVLYFDYMNKLFTDMKLSGVEAVSDDITTLNKIFGI